MKLNIKLRMNRALRKKIYLSISILSMVLNSFYPFFASYQYVYAEGEAVVEESASVSESTGASEEETTSEEPAADTSSEESTPTEETASEEPATESAAVEENLTEETTTDPVGDVLGTSAENTEETQPTETTGTEGVAETQPAVDEAELPDILPDGVSDYRPEATSEPGAIDGLEATSESGTEIIPVTDTTDATDPVVETIEETIPAEIEKECLADGVEIIDSVVDDWVVDSEKGYAETKENVKLGVKYIFPVEEGVTLTFSCLPKNEDDRSVLRIQQVKVSDLNLPDEFQTDAEYAYDITTDMEDGTFEYDLTLPKPEGVDVEVSYTEKSVDEAMEGIKADDMVVVDITVQDSDYVQVEDLEHFTLFIASYSDQSLLTPSSQFSPGSYVYINASSLVQNDYYNVVVYEPGGETNWSSSCIKAGNSKEFTIDNYQLPMTASIGDTWTVKLFVGTNNNCDSPSQVGDALSFGVVAAPVGTYGFTAGSCIKDQPGAPSQINCVAKDVGLANAVVTPKNGDTCDFPGDTITLDLSADVNVTAEQRYDIGIWISTDGDPNGDGSVSGACSTASLPIPPAVNLDGDYCGDVEGTATDPDLSGVALGEITLTCSDTDGNGFLDVPIITTWDQSAGGVCSASVQTVPGSPAKCKMIPSFNIPVTVPGQIIVNKQTTPDGSEQVFGFAISSEGSPLFNFDLKDNGSWESGVDSPSLSAGTYVVSEEEYSNWDLDSATCVSKKGTSTITNGTTVALVNGDVVTCTFNNTQFNPSISVEKSSTTTEITYAGQVVDYSFDVTNEGNQTLTGITVSDPMCDVAPAYQSGDTNTNSKLDLTETWVYTCNHTVTVTEMDNSGGNGSLDNMVTADSVESEPATDDLNIPVKAGKIIIEKQTLPGKNTEEFGFDPSWSDTNFNLQDGEQNDSGWLAPATYNISEIVPTGWDLTDITCTGSVGNSGQSAAVANAATINLAAGETVTCVFTNTKFGYIQGKKFEDVNNNGTRQPGEPYLNEWTIKLYEWGGETWEDSGQQKVTGRTGILGQYKFDNLNPGRYLVCEELEDGWIQTAPADGIEYNGTRCHEIDLEPGEAETGKLFGNFKLGVVQGMKYNDMDGDGNSHEEGEMYMNNWTVRLYKEWQSPIVVTSSNTGTTGQYKFENLEPGTYQLCEVMKEGWTQTWPKVGDIPVADNGLAYPAHGTAVVNTSDATDEASVCWQTVISESNQLNMLLRFGNAELRRTHGYKYSDLNGNGIVDGDDGPIEGWEIALCRYTTSIPLSGVEGEISSVCKSMGTDTTDENGRYEFTNLLPGMYRITEEQRPYYNVISPSGGVFDNVDIAQEGVYDFFNQPLEPNLTISKVNDSTGPEDIGNEVQFTIKVKATGAPLTNLVVVDLLSDGFEFQSGSWHAWSSDAGRDVEADIVTNGGVGGYTSPGSWPIGNIAVDEEITLTYNAEIQSGVDAGIYKDIAYAKAIDPWKNPLRAEAIDPGDLDDPGDIFVGTEVEVKVPAEHPVAEAEVDEEEVVEEVLGSSTVRLPATGASTAVLISALATMILGMIMLRVSKKKKLIGPAIVTMLFSVLCLGKTYAQTSDLMVRIEDLQTSYNEPFDITFVTLDLQGRSLNAYCEKDGPNDSGWFEFDSITPLPKAGGDTGVCELTSGDLNGAGSYAFRVRVVAGEDEVSDEATTTYDNEAPDKPKYIEVNKTSACDYEIEFKTANDGETEYVEVYMSDDKEFTANAASRIRTINIGPDEEYEFDESVSGDDCNHRQYFAVRAFDSAGNGSDVEAEEITDIEYKTIYKEETEEVIQEAYAGGAASTIGGEGTGTGGEEVILPGEEPTGGEEGSILGEQTQGEPVAEKGFFGKLISSPWTWIVLILGLGAITINGIKKSKQE